MVWLMSKHSMRLAGSGQAQQVAQGFAAQLLRVAAGQFAGQGDLGIARGQLQVAGALAAHAPLQLHLALGRAPTAPIRSAPHRGSRDPARFPAAGSVRRSTGKRRPPALRRRCPRHWSWGRRRACRGCGRRGMRAAARRRRVPCMAQASTSRSAARPSTYWRACMLRSEPIRSRRRAACSKSRRALAASIDAPSSLVSSSLRPSRNNPARRTDSA